MNKLKQILSSDITPGLLLLFVTALAIYLRNSDCCSLFNSFIHAKVGFSILGLDLVKSVEHWVNDGLMVIFFLFVGLEIKRELRQGNLSTRDQMTLPAIGALGGMLVPAAIFLGLNPGGGEATRGWAIPCATDIAFAIGILSLLGSRVPISLRVALTALAIIDDLGAIVIIALFYSSSLSSWMLVGAALTTLALVIFNRKGVISLTPYLLLGVVLWIFVLKSGIHATIAGVILALTIPLRVREKEAHPPLIRLEHALKPWVFFLIMPVFAFVNAGVDLSGFNLDMLNDPITGGTMFGLFLGKQLGVFLACAIAIKLGLSKLPEGASWGQLYGLSVLTGIGFTMSLFIGALAYTDANMILASKVGIIIGSLASAIWGLLVLFLCSDKNKVEHRL